MTIIRIDNVRLAFCHVFVPQAQDPKKPEEKKFSVASLFTGNNPAVTIVPTTEQLAAGQKPVASLIQTVIEQVAQEKYGTKWQQVLQGLRLNHKALVVDGNTKAKNEGYGGNWFFNASNAVRPDLRDEKRNPLVPGDTKPYSGCYASVIADVWAMDNQHGQRINATLLGVQFRRDGDAFSGAAKIASADMFEDVVEGSDASDLV